jgi:class 3 adenylate cyclase
MAMAAILIVDDEPSARLTLGLLLRNRGHLVRQADGVAAATRALAADAFDVVVTDLRMPDGVGLDVLREAKTRCPEAEVILLTAHPGWESAKEAMRLGAFDYFEKGQEPDGLFRRIDRALEEQAFRRGAAAPRPGGGERRFLTVLFADLRGSMELLAGQDLELARQVLDTVIECLMDAVHRAGGTVNQVMGDGIMALFGAPVPLPDHAARACRAALQMQEAVGRYAATLRRRHRLDVRIRVGINSGEVIVRSVGSDLRWDYTAVGAPTHIAARMEQLATPGTTVVTEATRRLVEPAIGARPLGPVVVKGLAGEVLAYELVGPRSAGGAAEDPGQPRGGDDHADHARDLRHPEPRHPEAVES